MDRAKWQSLLTRYRTSFKDLAIVVLIMAVATFYAWQVDIFVNENAAPPRERTIELDESLLLCGLLVLALFVFALRRYAEQKRETRRRIAAEQQARELAFQDGLTGLPNRRQFEDALRAALAAPPRAGAVHAVFFLDLNGFKQVNDVHGHSIGDEVLIVVAQRLLSAIREGDLLARFGGDEFALLARHLGGAEAVTSVALRLIQSLEPTMTTGRLRHQVGAGIGIALIPDDALTPEEVLRKADVALYRAKAERRSALRFFEPQMDRQVREREQMEQELRSALEEGAIKTVFQPCFNLRNRDLVGFEAALQWNHPRLGLIPPERFVPIAEETGLIHALAAGLMREACAAATGWPKHVTLAVDVFPGQLRSCDFREQVLAVLAEYALSPQRLEIAIPESALVEDFEGAREGLGRLRESGVRIALDNFGTGYSSLYHLRNFKLDKIKIDRSFVASMDSKHESAAIVNALVGLGGGLGLTVAAEGIDNPQQQALLLRSGCEQGQGGLYSEALSAAGTMALFDEPVTRLVAQHS